MSDEYCGQNRVSPGCRTISDQEGFQKNHAAFINCTDKGTIGLISIAIPSYEMHGRGTEFLDFSLNKISQQSYKNIEVVISDHSVDNKIEDLCKQWSDRLTMKYLRNGNKIGNSSANLNNAMLSCSGDVIKILFQDDFLIHERSIEDIVDAFSANTQADWLVTASEHSPDGVVFTRPFYPGYNDGIHLGNNTISSPSVLAVRNRGLLLFDENLIWLMDCEYYKRLYLTFGDPLILNTISVVNRVWGSQLSNLIAQERREEELSYVLAKYHALAITRTSKIYIAIPHNYETGGVEALHQLSDKLIELGFDCCGVYKTSVSGTILRNGKPVSGAYDKYIVREANGIEDCEDNILIVPEVWTTLLDHFNRIRKCIWWLSVDNNLRSAEGKFDRWKDESIFHLFQSDYAENYVKAHKASGCYLGEYINPLFVGNEFDTLNRKDIVLFNPAKGKEITDAIIHNCRHDSFAFVPLQGFNSEQLFSIYNRSKVYIDFGAHPGMDRIPRETAMCGCCVIVGKRGAALSDKDVPIPDEYKFEIEDIDGICARIRDCISHYDLKVSDFDSYRKVIKNQETMMSKDINNIFINIPRKRLHADASDKADIIGVIFSKDRAMQLDGTLRSFYKHCRDSRKIAIEVLYTTSNTWHEKQYQLLKAEYPSVSFIREKNFRDDLLSLARACEYILFLVDDNIFVKDFSVCDAVDTLRKNSDAIGFSLRIGKNTSYCYMLGKKQTVPGLEMFQNRACRYDWTTAECDFGYPLEVSSSIYKAADMLPLLRQLDYRNPNTLESVLDSNKNAFLKTKKALLCFEQSVTFCNPVNMVQTMWKNRAGGNSLYTPEKLAEMFDEGYRIDTDKFCAFTPNSCHQETNLAFIKPEGAVPQAETHATPFVSIIILNHNGLDHIGRCLESVRKNTAEQHEVIVVDNASTDGSLEYLHSVPDLILIENRINIGCPPARAQAMAIARGDYVVLLDNDTVVTKAWITKFIKCLRSDTRIGIIGPRSNYVSGQQLVPGVKYGNIIELESFAEAWSCSNMNRITPTHRLVGFCMFITRAVIDKIGSIDASFGKFGFEDDDYTWRANIAGFKTVIADDIFIHHTGGPQGRGDNQYNRLLLEAWEKFKSKWDLPKELKYGSQFNISGILSRPFSSDKNYVSLSDTTSDKKEKNLILDNVLKRAGEAYAKDDIDKAIGQLIEGLKYFPDAAEIYHLLAEISIDSKRYQDALDGLTSMPNDAKNDLKSLELLGYCMEGLGRNDEAEAYADKAFLLNSISAPALNLKGIVAYKKGNVTAAEEYFKKAVESDPHHGEPYANLGVLLWAQGKHEEGFDYLEKGFNLSPKTSDIVLLYQNAVNASGNLTRAETLIREKKTSNLFSKKIAFFLINILLQQEKYRDAMAEIEQAMTTFGIDDGMMQAALAVREKVGVKEIKNKKKDPSISLCMIVKNEESHLAKCLLGIEDLADEMIVIDTGSMDMTRDIAKAFGAKVYDFEWTQDFSEARNLSISKASGEWILILDADEVISRKDYAALKKLVRKKKRDCAYAFTTRNYVDRSNLEGCKTNDGIYEEEAGLGWFPSCKARLFPNDSAIRFENPVHELVEPSIKRINKKILSCLVPVHHYGKLNIEKSLAKGEEYYLLGKKKLEERGDDRLALLELALQAAELKKFYEAIELWHRLIKIEPDFVKAYFNLGYIYLTLGEYEAGIKASKKASELDPNMKETVLNYSSCELYGGSVVNAVRALEDASRKHPDYLPVIALLGIAYIVEGNINEGCVCIERIKKRNIDCPSVISDHAKEFIRAGRMELAARLLKTAVSHGYVNSDILGQLEALKKR